MNMQDFYDGKSFNAYEFFGAHQENGGVMFRTFAPNAKKVFVVGEFTEWNQAEMHQQHQSGIYSFFNTDAKFGQMYKYVVLTQEGRSVYHCDPYGFGMQLRPNNASYIVDLSEYTFHDEDWIKSRDKGFNRPINIYELHLGSWVANREAEHGWFRYDELANRLIEYVKKYRYTHVEFLPITEHPSDSSWGYQITGFFSPTSRYGTARELMELIDKCHQHGIGVIMDFVPVHFALDDYGLGNFDGTALYEYPHSDVGVSEWETRNFNHSRGEVRTFLQSCANYWLDVFHFDGIRMDAISNAIYWQGNPSRGVNENAVSFLKNMNEGLSRLHPTVMLIAEDSTSFPGVTSPTDKGGLGFDYKWDLGWMNDTLSYFRLAPKYRPQAYHKLTFSMHYFYNEHFILPFSHDEVVHGIGTIIQKMWGDSEDKLRQLRALYLYMYSYPGKKLNFMGNEFAQNREWDEAKEQDWELLQNPTNKSFHEFIRKLSVAYQEHPALYVGDYEKLTFEWIESSAIEQSIYGFIRGTGSDRVAAVFNFSDTAQSQYLFKFTTPVRLKLLISSADISDSTFQNENQDVLSSESTGVVGEYLCGVDLPAFTGKLFLIELI